MSKEISTQDESLNGMDDISNIFSISPIGIFIFQGKKIKFANQESSNITGYSCQELIESDSLSLIPSEEKVYTQEKIEEMLRHKKSMPFLTKIVHKNRETKYLLLTVCNIQYQGSPATLAYFFDTTEQERLKEALKTSEEKFYKAFRASPDWVVISTFDDGVYLEVNQAFLQTTGYEMQEVIGKTSVDLGIWEDPRERDELHGILQEYGRVSNAEVKFRTKQDQLLHVLWSAEVIEYGGQKCLIAITRDITHRKLVEQERLNREKLQGVLEIAGATCHEMNQPLQNIYFILDDMLDKYQDKQLYYELKEQIKRLKETTSKLQNITKYETKDYIQGNQIIDIDKASFQCPINPDLQGDKSQTD